VVAVLVLSACAAGVDEAPDGAGPPGDDSAQDAGGGVDGASPTVDTGTVSPRYEASTEAASGDDDSATPSGDDSAPPGDDAASDDSSSDDASGAMDAGPPDAGNGDDSSMSSDTGSSTCAAHGFSGALVTFDLSAQAGNETSAAPTAAANGATAGALSRSSALTAVSGTGSINASGWGTGSSADGTRYFTFSVTPAAGCTLSLTSLALDVKASTTGPSKGDVATSADGFAAHTASFVGTSAPSVAFTGVSGTGAIEVRVYGYGATGTAGTLRVQNTMVLSGTLQ